RVEFEEFVYFLDLLGRDGRNIVAQFYIDSKGVSIQAKLLALLSGIYILLCQLFVVLKGLLGRNMSLLILLGNGFGTFSNWDDVWLIACLFFNHNVEQLA